MRITQCLGWLALACWSSAGNLRPRNHETHDYYALHLRPDTSPQHVASALGLDYEGKLGELPDHHTFSSPRTREHGADGILDLLRRRRRKRDVSTGVGALDGILWSQKQEVKPRMQKRTTIPQRPARDGPHGGEAEGGTASTAEAGKLIAVPNEPPRKPPAVEAAVAARDEIARMLSIEDPIFGDQWHLFNTVQLGHDINVTGVWTQGVTGHNTTVVMVDDGIDMYSDDLKDNYFAEGSYDFNDNTDEPKPRLSDDRHGTRCAGEIAAVRNGVCGVGVAYNAKIGGLRILSKVITDEDEAVAMNYKYQQNQIYSCSWGPPDDGMSMDAPGILIERAMVNAVQNGRGGKGNIFVFAAGNGAGAGDNCNFDGYTNSIYSITVGAIDRKGMHPYYSEKCSAQLVVTYSSGSGDAIHTTDVGVNACYENHGGTSAAAPLGAGVFALAFSVRPELTWRDLQNILVETAVPVNEEDEEEWDTTHIGKKFSHTYGYGKLDAYRVVEKAKEIELLKPQAWLKSPWLHVKQKIPEGVEGLLSSYDVSEEDMKKANLERLEHVTVTMNIEHARRGDLSVELRSPTGLVSHLSVVRRLDEAATGYVDWTFSSVAHWGEPGIGTWSVLVKDTEINAYNGTFTDWRLTLWGECIDPTIQPLLPMPTETDDDDHDIMTASASLHPIATGTGTDAGLPGNPSDHPDRPVNAKPTDVEDVSVSSTAEAISTSSSSSSSTSSSSATATATSEPDTTSSPIPTPSSDHFLPHYFPTFGVSKRTQIWIYGSLLLILLFCSGLGAYFYIQHRKRKRASREDYEFEMLEEEEALNGVAKGKGGRGKRRGGELYDAFAGESEDEGLLSDEDGEGFYRDHEPEDDGDGEGNRGRSKSRDGEKQ